MKPVFIESGRFVLRPLAHKDVNERYLSWINGEGRSDYIEYSKQKKSRSDIISYVDSKNDKEDILLLGIFVKETGEHIGYIKYEPIDFIARFSIVGILIGEENWRGRGVATEVIKHSSMWLHERFNMEKIVLSVNVDNIAAVRAYEKADFKKRKTPYIEIIHEKQLTMVLDFK